MQEREKQVKIEPHFVPVFEIDKPLTQEQLKGLVNWFREESYPNQVIYFDQNPDKNLTGFGILAEPTGSFGVGRTAVNRARLPKNSKLQVSLGEVHGQTGIIKKDIEKIVTFAENARSWNDSITLTPTSQGTLEIKRVCTHPKSCPLGKKSTARRILEKIA